MKAYKTTVANEMFYDRYGTPYRVVEKEGKLVANGTSDALRSEHDGATGEIIHIDGFPVFRMTPYHHLKSKVLIRHQVTKLTEKMERDMEYACHVLRKLHK